jgi:hypothetical protein
LDHVAMLDRPFLDVRFSRATSVAIAATIATAASSVRVRRCLAHFIQSLR